MQFFVNPLTQIGEAGVKTIHACPHCGELDMPSTKKLCDNCKTMELRKAMHQENEAIIPGWICNFCTKLAKKALSTP